MLEVTGAKKPVASQLASTVIGLMSVQGFSFETPKMALEK